MRGGCVHKAAARFARESGAIFLPHLFMKTFTSLCATRWIAAALCLGVAWPALGAPKKEPKAAASPAQAASPAAEARPFPFKSSVVSVDKAARTFRMGKTTVHQVHVLPETKLAKGDESPATFEAIVVGEEIRGSVRKRADGDYEAISIKIGPKVEAVGAAPKAGSSPAAASPSPRKAKSPAKEAAPAPSPNR